MDRLFWHTAAQSGELTIAGGMEDATVIGRWEERLARAFQEENIPDVVAHAVGASTTRLRDGTVGYYVRAPRNDDCWAAAVGTCLQIPIEEVPDSRLDERLAAGEDPEAIDHSARRVFAEWLEERCLRMKMHRKIPIARRRWIGVVRLEGHFSDHCMVMSRGDVLFDPSDRGRAGRPVRHFGADDVDYGISFRAAKEQI